MADGIEEVGALEAELRRAMLTGDVAALSALIDDRLVFTGPDGAVLGKAEDLAAHASGTLRIAELDVVDAALHPLDGLVIATARAALSGTYAGSPIRGTFAYTRVWSRASGRWRIVAGHASALG